MKRLDVIGNVSRDVTRYPDGRGRSCLGGAALFVALAAAKAGRASAPVSVLGDDLAQIPQAVEWNSLDWSASTRAAGKSTRFDLHYDARDELATVRNDYGVAALMLTAHALGHVDRHPENDYHICCRRPLGAASVLTRLVSHGARFSVDFFLPSAEQMIQYLAPSLHEARTVFVNAAEYRHLRSLTDAASLPEVVVTDGPRTAFVLAYGAEVASVTPPLRQPHEVSGAGDTLAGTFLAHRARGATPHEALSSATEAASAFVTSPSLDLPQQRHA